MLSSAGTEPSCVVDEYALQRDEVGKTVQGSNRAMQTER
jgi:hypothetical protein